MVLGYLIAIPLGLLLGVRAMILGIEKAQQQLRASPFNLPTVGAALTTVGITGYLLDRYSTLGTWSALAIALAAGLLAATGVFSLIAGWAVPGARAEVEDERYVLQGHLGVVSNAIGPAGATGAITFEHDGLHSTVPALSLDGAPIVVGTDVVIERIEDGVAHVELWSVIEKQLEIE